MRSLLLKGAQSSTIPSVVIGLMLLAVFAYLTHIMSVLLSDEFLNDIDAYNIFALYGLEVKANRTNWNLSQQASHFNNITMEIYRGQMVSELSNFQGLVEFFNS